MKKTVSVPKPRSALPSHDMTAYATPRLDSTCILLEREHHHDYATCSHSIIDQV